MIDSPGTISGLPSIHRPDELAGEWADIEAAKEHPTAFAPLYQRYRDRIYAYIRTRTPNEEDASDLTQQVFLRALDALVVRQANSEQ